MLINLPLPRQHHDFMGAIIREGSRVLAAPPVPAFDADLLTVAMAGELYMRQADHGYVVPVDPVRIVSPVSRDERLGRDMRRAGAHGDLHAYLARVEWESQEVSQP